MATAEFPELVEIPEEDEEVLGTPTFEVLVRDGRPLSSGSYFMAPPRYMADAGWDPDAPNRLLVTATDGSRWYADNVAKQGKANAVLRRLH
ncbi:MAG: hypothetical protein JWM76_4085 [Pseudonocardiales bacterium]|nr:hypothetical protein [Pseudonocardiales bacterium]